MKLAIFFLLMVILSIDVFADSCDYGVEILVEGSEFESQDFKWRMKATKIEGKSTNITGTAEIESSGKTFKSYKPWTSDTIAKQKTSNEYSPNLKPGNYEITAEISVDCDDTSKDNNVDKKEIKIKGEAEKTEEAKTSSKKTESAKAEEQDVEDTSLQSATPKRSAVSEPIQQKPSSSTIIKAENFDNVIELRSQSSQKAKETMATANIVKNPEKSEIVYESSSEKAKGWIMIFLLTLSILLNIVLIWKR